MPDQDHDACPSLHGRDACAARPGAPRHLDASICLPHANGRPSLWCRTYERGRVNPPIDSDLSISYPSLGPATLRWNRIRMRCLPLWPGEQDVPTTANTSDALPPQIIIFFSFWVRRYFCYRGSLVPGDFQTSIVAKVLYSLHKHVSQQNLLQWIPQFLPQLNYSIG